MSNCHILKTAYQYAYYLLNLSLLCRIFTLNLKQRAMCKAWGINLHVRSEIGGPPCHQPKQRAEMI